MNIDLSKVRNIEFNCIDQCGKCCFYQAPVLTTTEINRTLGYLKAKPYEELENFALDCLTYLNMLPQLTKNTLSEYVKSLSWFWSPFHLEEAKECILVRTYTIHSMPSSGRCKLLNPIDRRCLVYQARPDTCRLYPFTQKRDSAGTAIIELGMKNCPGINKGPTNLNKKEIEQLTQRDQMWMAKDITAYKEYIEKEKIERIEVTKKKPKLDKKLKDIDQAILEFEENWRDMYFFGKKQKFSFKDKRFIEPLAELGIIPKHPLLVLWNENLNK